MTTTSAPSDPPRVLLRRDAARPTAGPSGWTTAALALLLAVAACAPTDDDRPTPGAGKADSVSLGPADGEDLAGADLDRIQVGQEAPDFSLESYDGGVVTLSDLEGETNVLLVFYRGHW